jgi:hypothetical protein
VLLTSDATTTPGAEERRKKKKKKKGENPPRLAPSPTRRQLELILSINTSCAAEADQGLVDV